MAIRLTAEEVEVRAGARKHVDMLAGVIGERSVERPGTLEASARYIENCLRGWGYEPRRQMYKAQGETVANIEVEVRGTRRPEEIVILGGHYDSVCAGADDNASAVAGVLEAARLLAGKKFKRTLRFVFFVNEEPPFYKGPEMGSWVYAKGCRARGEKIVGMINLEMLGCFLDEPGSQRYPPPFDRKPFGFLPKEGNFIAMVSDFASARLLYQVRRGFKKTVDFPCWAMPAPAQVQGPGMSDHWSFWQEGYRALMVTDTSFFRYAHYHKESDTPDKLDFDRMARVIVGVAGATAGIAGILKK